MNYQNWSGSIVFGPTSYQYGSGIVRMYVGWPKIETLGLLQ